MAISVFDLFTIGIGPSSSHTVGPMRAANRFVTRLRDEGHFADVGRVKVTLHGSLAHTGRGHGTDKAVVSGLEGERPEEVDPDRVHRRWEEVARDGRLELGGERTVSFEPATDLRFDRRQLLPLHSNGMRFVALAEDGRELDERVYYSVGGGFVVNRDEAGEDRLVPDETPVPFPYASGADLLSMGRDSGRAIWEMTLDNERVRRSDDEIFGGLDEIWQAMRDCVARGCRHEGTLPGGLAVKRRAPALHRELTRRDEAEESDPLRVLDWVNLFALAVNEENAAGGRVVTAPTNGAAGVIPAVLHYYRELAPRPTDDGIYRFLLTAGAIGILYKENASISGAEVGCQGEVGVACSMAAAGLTAALGGSNEKVENAAEIGMEHNLGLTCDPVGGLVQIPCIERNAMGAVKAINAWRIASRGDGSQKVSLDKVIETMRQTGADMKRKYKETSRGGLAINVVEC